MISDAEIARGCLRGKKSAQELLFKKFAPKMMGVCLRYFRNIPEAEDALQEGFIKVFHSIESYSGTGSLEGWIRKIMVNTSLNQLRRNLKHAFQSDFDDLSISISDDSVKVDNSTTEDLLKLIHELPLGYRTVFNLYEIEGYNHKEIGEMLNISDNTSKSQLLKARQILRKKLIELNPDYSVYTENHEND